MAYKLFIANAYLTASEVNTYLMNQATMTFASAAARTAAIAAPTRGMVSMLLDTGAVEVYVGATTGWRPPWNTAWGVAQRVTSTATTAGIGTETDVLTATFTAVANRRYRIMFQVQGQASAATTTVFQKITDNTPSPLQSVQYAISASFSFANFCMVDVTPSAGAVTYRGRIAAVGGTVTLNAVAGQLHQLWVEDIGPFTSMPAA